MKSNCRRTIAVIVLGAVAAGLPNLGVAQEQAAAGVPRGPLRVLEENPRYFTDGSGKAVYLTGSHTWSSFQDSFKGDQARPTFDYAGYLSFLKERGHNFVRMWTWEGGVNDVRYEPLPYARTDSGKFDLNKFNEAYFERLRSRVAAARAQGIYVSIMLFQGWSIYSHGHGNPWPIHPFHAANNVNGIDGDRDKDGEGKEVHSLEMPAVTRLQEAYVRKVIDTVNDFDNVLYEVTNETAIYSKNWQYHIVNFVKQYEKTKSKQHPIGMTAFDSGREGSMDALLRGPADWISPQNDGESGDYQSDPPAADGRKVIVSDTDHLWGVGGGRDWVWKSFTRGHQPIYMDPLRKGDKSEDEEMEMEGARKAMGQTRRFAERVALREMKPAQEISSTRYCLATPGKEYIVYLPKGGKVTVDLSRAKGEVTVEWLDPVQEKTVAAANASGGATRELGAPFAGPAVLYLKTTGRE
jgi:hypothetical protein